MQTCLFNIGDKVKVGYTEDNDLIFWMEENNIEALIITEIDLDSGMAWLKDVDSVYISMNYIQ